MKFLINCLLIFGAMMVSASAHSQTYTTESKSCGSCGKAVSNNSRTGMTCPHCGVRWGYENERQTSTYRQNTGYEYGSTNNSTVMTTSNINLRAKPSTKATVIKVIPAYQTVTVLRSTGDWYYVEYNDLNSYRSRKLSGYVHKSVVR